MNPPPPTHEPRTARGRATRDKMLGAAAELIHRQGVHGTSVDQVLAASGAGKSQFYHYFENKEGLVEAVVDHQVERLFAIQEPLLARLDSWDGIRAWFRAVVASHRAQRLVGGCPIGSLAVEMADWDPALAARLSAVFDRWRDGLAEGLAAMRDRGELSTEADPKALAGFVVAVQQGAILLACTAKSLEPLENALDHALRYLQGYRVGEAADQPEIR